MSTHAPIDPSHTALLVMDYQNGIIGMVAWSNRWFNPHQASASAQEIGSQFADVLLAGLSTQPH